MEDYDEKKKGIGRGVVADNDWGNDYLGENDFQKARKRQGMLIIVFGNNALRVRI